MVTIDDTPLALRAVVNIRRLNRVAGVTLTFEYFVDYVLPLDS